VNDPALTAQMLPTLRRIAGADRVIEAPPRTGGEDFAFFAQRVPGLYVWLGIHPPGVDANAAAPNHSPSFFLDEDALVLGVRIMAGLAVDFLAEGAAAP
jgi:amidohydrolase